MGSPERVKFAHPPKLLLVDEHPAMLQQTSRLLPEGYVVKSHLADLVPALQAVLEGKRFISPCSEVKDWDDTEP